MAATWSIATLDRQVSLDGKADVVTAAHWEVTDFDTVGSGDDEITYSGRVYGTIALDTSDLSSFTPYQDITEEEAISWAKAALGSDEVSQKEKAVADQITEAKTPTKGTGRPWDD